MTATKKRKKKVRGKPPKYTARTADKHELYESAVQQADIDVVFIDEEFRKHRGRAPLSLREDFCGTAWMCAEWVKSHAERVSVGLDLDQETMDWGWKRHMEPLGEAKERVKLLHRDVLEGEPGPFDVIAAFNFSYCTFKERKELLRYFQGVRRDIAEDGMFILDIYGGTDVGVEMEEETEKDGFTYVWDQKPYDAIQGTAKRHIHFEFADGSRIAKAFTYDWRIWQLPELRDVLIEAGFAEVDVYWEGVDEHGEGDGVFTLQQNAENEDAFIAYLTAWPAG